MGDSITVREAGLLPSDKSSTEIKDDSFDAEFSLLESTLTELKDNGIEETSANKSSEINVSTDCVDELPEINYESHVNLSELGLDKVSVKETHTKVSMPSDFRKNSRNMSPLESSNKLEEGNSGPISSTTHLKSTNHEICQTNIYACSLENSSKHPKFVMSSNPEDNILLITNSLLKSQESSTNGNTKTNDRSIDNETTGTIVSQCDSSLEEVLKNKSSERAFLSIPIAHKNQESNEPTSNSNNALDSNDSDILYHGLDYSPTPSPAGEAQVCSIISSNSAETEVLVTSGSDDHEKHTNEANVYTSLGINSEVSKSDMGQCTETDIKDGIVIDMETPSITPKIVDNVTETCNSSVSMICSKETMCETKSNVLVCDSASWGQTLDCETYNNEHEPEASNENETIFSSTPVPSATSHKTLLKSDSHSENSFEQMSPLDIFCGTSKKNLKRKNLGLESIEEVDEDVSNIGTEKKLKLIDTDIFKEDLELKAVNEASIGPCFEAPAKSILKKWQSSCLSRSSVTGSFLVLDECGESDVEDNTKRNEEILDPALTDDFEVACNSLTEELNKSSSNVGSQEKYCSRVQWESQQDDDVFDELVDELEQELTLNYDEKTSLSVKPMEESLLTDQETTLINKTGEDCNMDETIIEGCKDKALLPDYGRTETQEENLATTTGCVVEGVKSSGSLMSTNQKNSMNDEVFSGVTVTVKVKDEAQGEASSSNETEIPECSNARSLSGQKSSTDNLSIIYADGKDMTMDEEDFLLEQDVSANKKPYVFFEYVSSDPQENEDNYNPEWQKLGKLTSDEERYKAVRDRWRSLVPPDPNRDLTCRQWREKNNKPPINFSSLNNNYHMNEDNERNQLCTAVFENKIKAIRQSLEDRWRNIVHQRNVAFEDLAHTQDQQQRMLDIRGGTALDLIIMRKHHLEECRNLKSQYDQKLEGIRRDAEGKINVLRECSEEVLLFQKFYKGVGSRDDEVCMYLTDTQVQELMETEDMLEQYAKFYQP